LVVQVSRRTAQQQDVAAKYLERFQEKSHDFSGSKARQNKDLEHLVISFGT